MRIEGLEPPRRKALEPESSVSTNFTISAYGASTRTRTGTPLPARDFKSLVSTYSTMEAVVPVERIELPSGDYKSPAKPLS